MMKPGQDLSAFCEKQKESFSALSKRLSFTPIRDEADLDDIACQCEILASNIRNWFFLQGSK